MSNLMSGGPLRIIPADQQEAEAERAAEVDAQIAAGVPDTAATIPTEGQAFFNFNDPQFFRDLVSDRGLDAVTRDVVEVVNAQFDGTGYNFTYEQFRDGTADVLKVLPDVDQSRGDKGRALSNEQILSLWTDVEDYGKFSAPKPVLDPETGEQVIDPETNLPLFEESSPKMDAFVSGVKEAAIPAAFSLPGAIAGGTLAAAKVPFLPGVPGLVLKGGAFLVGGVVGGGATAMIGDYVDDLIFDDPDPILLPSLQAAYNAGETFTYGISAAATPLVALKLPGKPIVETFQGSKFLENFKSVASNTYNPKVTQEALLKSLGPRQYQKALAARQGASEAAAQGPIKGALSKFRPDPTKGPLSVRATTGLIEGSAAQMANALKNPKTALGFEALTATFAGTGAYMAEKAFPNSAIGRFMGEIGTGGFVLPGIQVTKKLATGSKNVLANLYNSIEKRALPGKFEEKQSAKIQQEANKRLFEYINQHPLFVEAGENPDAKMNALIKILLDPTTEGGEGLVPSQLAAERLGEGSGTAKILDDLERELASGSTALEMASDEGREQVISQAKRNIETLSRTGNPEALRLAAVLQQTLMEQSIITNLENATSRLERNMQRLYGDGPIPEDVANEMSPRLFKLLEVQVAASKARENALWNSVPDFELVGFKDFDGNPSDTPMSVEIFRTAGGRLDFQTQGARDDLAKALGAYKKDFDDLAEYYDSRAGASDGSVPEVSTTVTLPSERRLQNTLDKLQGLEGGPADDVGMFVATKRDAQGRTENEIITDLRTAAENYRAESANASLDKESRRIAGLQAKAHDETAEVMIARARKLKSDTDKSQSVSPDDPKPFTLKYLQEIRTNLNKDLKSAQSGSNPDYKKAGILNQIIRGLDHDLNNVVPERTFLSADGELLTVSQAKIVASYNAAKAYTKARYDVYERSFIGSLGRQDSQGSSKTNADDLFKLFRAGNTQLIPRKIQELNRAAQEIDDPSSPQVTSEGGFGQDVSKFEGVETVYLGGGRRDPVPFDAEQQELELNEVALRIVRNSLRRFTKTVENPETGEDSYRINTAAVKKYINSEEGQKIFSIYPSLKGDLEDSVKLENLVRAVEKENNAFSLTPENKAFRLFMNTPESSALSMSQIIGGQSLQGAKIPPARTLQKMVDEINRLPDQGSGYTKQEVLDGFRSAILGAAALKSGNFGTKFDAKSFQSALFDPLPGVDVSYNFTLMDFMQKNNLVDADYVKNIKSFIKQINTVDEALAMGDNSQILFKNVSDMNVANTRILGAASMSMALARVKALLGEVGINISGGAAEYIAGGEGAKIGEKLLITMPETLTVQQMTRIVENPQALALSLQSYKKVEDRNKIIEAMNSAMGGQVMQRLPYLRRATAEEIQERSSERREGVSSTLNPNYNPITVKFLDRVKRAAAKRSQPATPEVQVPLRAPDPAPVPQPQPQPVTQLQQPVPPPTMAPAPVAPPTAPSGPVDRSQYAALFPNDMASGLIRASNQGIGSLMT